jgi:hypothetical protein
MERYKLVKEYPGSPDKGTIVYSPHRSQAYKDMKYKMKDERNVTNQIFFSQDYIENHPEFWKKMRKK